MLEGLRVQVEVSVGRFTVDLMAQGAIWFPVYVGIEKGYVVVSLCLDGELYTAVKAQIFSSTPYSQTPSAYVPPAMSATKFHIHTKQQAKL